MFTAVLPVHKGFEIQTLIYPNHDMHGIQIKRVPKRDQGYQVSVRIFRAGIVPTDLTSRMFKLSEALSYDAIGEARRAGEKHGREIIDGDVKDE